MKFSILNGSHMNTHRISDLTVVHFFKCIFKLESRTVNILKAPRYLNPALNALMIFQI